VNRRPINPHATALAIARAAAVPRDHAAERIGNARRCLDLLLKGGSNAQAGWMGLAGVISIAQAFGELSIGRGDEAKRILDEATDTLARIWTQAEQRKTWALSAEQRAEVSERCGLLVDLYAVQLRNASQAEHERAFDRAKARIEGAQRGQVGKGVTVVGAA
jgi:hypothetical protein